MIRAESGCDAARTRKSSRALLETIAFWAMHRHFDPSPQQVDEDTAERAVVDLLLYGLLDKT